MRKNKVRDFIRQAITFLTAPTKLRLGPPVASSADDLPRVLPLSLATKVWINKSFLLGALLVAIATIILCYFIRKGELPTFVALMLDKQVAKGVVDSVIRREVTKSKGMKETRWELKYHFTDRNGQQIQGESYTSITNLKKGQQVDVEFYPRRPQSNRIQGMSAKSDANNLSVFGLIVLAVGSVLSFFGLHDAYTTSKLLKFGSIAAAVVTHCQEGAAGAFWELNGIRWQSKSKTKTYLLSEYQKQVLDSHRQQFDSEGRYLGTAALRALHLLFAMFCGALICSFLAVGLTAFFFGFPRGWIVLGSACFGAVIMVLVEFRWRVLLRSNVGNAKLDGLPSQFKNRACILQLSAIGVPEPIQIEKELDLKGDASDFLPRPILYLPTKPTKAKFLDALGLKSLVGPDGELALIAESPLPQLAALLLIVSSALIGSLIAII